MLHREFAEIYDIFMKHVDYDGWYKFLKNYMGKKGEVLDMGCGTGEFIRRLLGEGYYVTGIDLSKRMLKVAEKKLKSEGFKEGSYELIEGNMTDYIHPHKVDHVICNFDTINYLKSRNELVSFMDRVSENLKKGGKFIFDAVTDDIFDEIFENGLFFDEEPEYTSIWRHEQLGEHEHLVEIDLFIKEKEEDNLFRKYNDKQYKFIYEPKWIIEMAEEKGFEIVDTATNPKFGESRIFFIMKKL